MTKEEAIKYLQQLYPNGGHCWLDEQRIEAIGMAIKALKEGPTTSIWHDAKDTPVASKTKIVLYTNGKWDMFKAYEAKDDYDNYWAGVNQALEEKGVLVKRWAYVEDLLEL